MTVETTFKRRNEFGRPYKTYWFKGSRNYWYRVETAQVAIAICWELSKHAHVTDDEVLQWFTDMAAEKVKKSLLSL